MFRNLSNVPTFVAHNFNDSSGYLRQEKGPSHDVAEAFRTPRPNRDPYLLSTLSFTLSPACCKSFLKANASLPATKRDYYLSKLFQFVVIAVNDESMDPSDWATYNEDLPRILDEQFPEGSPHLEMLWQLDWQTLFDDYPKHHVLTLLEKITSYIPSAPGIPSARGTTTTVRESPAQVIDRLRKKNNFKTIDDLAAKAGLNIKQVYRIKNGQSVTTDTLTTLAKTLGCPPGDLLP